MSNLGRARPPCAYDGPRKRADDTDAGHTRPGDRTHQTGAPALPDVHVDKRGRRADGRGTAVSVVSWGDRHFRSPAGSAVARAVDSGREESLCGRTGTSWWNEGGPRPGRASEQEAPIGNRAQGGQGALEEEQTYILMTSTSSFTAPADFCSAARSSAVSVISTICSTPRAPSFTGTPTKRSRMPYSPCR
jgi:hypothetical protein